MSCRSLDKRGRLCLLIFNCSVNIFFLLLFCLCFWLFGMFWSHLQSHNRLSFLIGCCCLFSFGSVCDCPFFAMRSQSMQSQAKQRNATRSNTKQCLWTLHPFNLACFYPGISPTLNLSNLQLEKIVRSKMCGQWLRNKQKIEWSSRSWMSKKLADQKLAQIISKDTSDSESCEWCPISDT